MEIVSLVTPGAVVFYLLAGLVLGSAAGVAFSRNILHSAFALLGTLGGVAGLYLYLGADFVGVVQILIYVGGILVLLLFAVLLTNRIGDVRLTNASAGLAAGAAAALVVLGALVRVALSAPWKLTLATAAPTTNRLGDAFLGEYLMLFELASVILLMALVGAMVIARRAVREKRDYDDRLA
jgi:NAD(P)H-quinone oxidoreductase subunit 6